MPAAEDRVKLAAIYLRLQRQHWPELVAKGLLPQALPDGTEDSDILVDMSQSLAHRHVNQSLDDAATTMIVSCSSYLGRLAELAAAYLRYSCDNSSARSLDDQLFNILNKAKSLNLFIPWPLVFADASVSGTDPSRQGYGALKAVVAVLPSARCILIDEFSRAGRDTLEWFRLAGWAKKCSKNLLGATDGFDLASSVGQMMLHVFAMFSEFFIRQLRDKVRRGMRGAADRGTSVGRPGLGYGLAPLRDQHGREVQGSDGRPIRVKQIHPPTMQFVELARRMLLEEGRSIEEVIVKFNTLKVDGSDGWTDCSLRRMLSNENLLGFDVYNRTTNEFDPDTAKRRTTQNPRGLWVVQAAPHLKVWDRRTYLAMRRKLRGGGSGGRGRRRRSRFGDRTASPSAAEQRPKRLAAGLLQCDCCQEELKEVRGGKHASYACFRGYFHNRGCTMGIAKAAVIVEEVILDFVSGAILSPLAVERLWQRSLQWVAKEAARPPVDVAPLQTELKACREKSRRLTDLVAGDPSPAFAHAREQIKTLYVKIQQLEEQLLQARRQQMRSSEELPPLTLTDVQGYLTNLRQLLTGGSEAAALALRSITGPIRVRSEPYAKDGRYGGRKGGRWILTFKPRLARALLQQAAATSQSPADTAVTPKLETAVTAEAELGSEEVTLVVDRRKSMHERLAPRVRNYLGQINPATGKPYTRAEVAKNLRVSLDVMHLAWRMAEGKPARGGKQPPASDAA